MAITAKVICDSISPEGVRLTTLHLRYPRMIHSEFMTHRVFSRNGRSSRAVPAATLLEEAPYVPHFMMNQPGMVASQEMSDEDRKTAEDIWLSLVDFTKGAVRQLNNLKVHKQWANRPLEWFGYIDVLVSSTDWANFFELRDEVGAQPEIDELAKAMKVAMDNSTPEAIKPGDWHMPYIASGDTTLAWQYFLDKNGVQPTELETIDILKKISVARCARLTIKPFDGDGSFEKELKRYELLMVSRPVHASPAEHVATPDDIVEKTSGDGEWYYDWGYQHEWGNFYGWRQFRKQIPYNTIEDR